MILIFCAPSGSGKSTIVNYLLQQNLGLEFSVSATTRKPRGQEQHGKHYYFLSREEFEQHIRNDDFVEYEQVYEGLYYGTLKSEVERIEGCGHHVIFDVDVKGGVNLKRIFGDRALAIFVAPPSLEELRRRLVGRQTDSPEMIEQRLAKAEYEMTFEPQFDLTILNDDLSVAKAEALQKVKEFLNM